MMSKTSMGNGKANLSLDQIDEFAQVIATACNSGRQIMDLPTPGVHHLSDAIRVQDRLFRDCFGSISGWFASATNRAMLKQLGLSKPYAGPWRSGRQVRSGTTVDPVGELDIVIEAEVTFRLSQDLPVRSAPYSKDEVAGAIGAAIPSIEIVISCYADAFSQDPLNLICEGGFAQYLVLGDEARNWQSLNIDDLPVSVQVNGREVETGITSAVLDGQLSSITWLANNLSERGHGLKKGQLCNTGMCAPIAVAQPGDEVTVSFGALGRAHCSIRAQTYENR